MKKFTRYILSIITLCLSFSLCACANNNTEHIQWKFSKKVARVVQEDGYVYTFDYLYSKDGSNSDTLIPFQFFRVNLRYQNNTDLDSQEFLNDMKKISEILDYQNPDITPEQLLTINKEDVDFEELDEDLFFNLMHEALNSEPHPEGDNVLPVYALMTEPEYLDKYKFQIGFVSDMGTVDAIYIDVLYLTDHAPNGYIQLSDMVDNGTASPEQEQAFNLIKNIADGIVKNNNLMYEYGANKDICIADIDFSRLYLFLESLDNNNYDKYHLHAQ